MDARQENCGIWRHCRSHLHCGGRDGLVVHAMMAAQHAYEIRPRKDHRGVDLISDALLFGRRWYGEPNAVSNAIG